MHPEYTRGWRDGKRDAKNNALPLHKAIDTPYRNGYVEGYQFARQMHGTANIPHSI